MSWDYYIGLVGILVSAVCFGCWSAVIMRDLHMLKKEMTLMTSKTRTFEQDLAQSDAYEQGRRVALDEAEAAVRALRNKRRVTPSYSSIVGECAQVIRYLPRTKVRDEPQSG